MSDSDVELVKNLANVKTDIIKEVKKVIIGQDDVIENILIALFAKGHCLFVGVPGLAKTLLINTLAYILDIKFNRIQFTPDLMPADITGIEILEEDHNTGRRFFKFVKGPIFTNILLADEINRTSPKTQAALLQSMQEYKVTAGGKTYHLDMPFHVFATQNPIEQEGTYPLPEAQLDRFMLWVDVLYPDIEEEKDVVMSTTLAKDAHLTSLLNSEKLLELQGLILKVPVSEYVVDYAVRMVRSTRPDDSLSPDFIKKWVNWGAGPRASQYLILGGKARAVMNGRYAVTCDDVRHLAKPVLKHRIITNFHAEAEKVRSDNLIDDLIGFIKE